MTNQQIYQRYVWAGMTRDAAALAEIFTADGVLETPLVSAGGSYPRRLEGREEIRQAMAAYYERSANDDRTVNVDKSRYVLHTTTDPNVFIVEIDTAFESPRGGEQHGAGSDLPAARREDRPAARLLRSRGGRLSEADQASRRRLRRPARPAWLVL
ncbi:nuclear transport factor 2 family protein [Nonomuraea sp. M3C6]|uniref:Nuclear transport factor 2 family protein n=1 Tax=Nonomuraea marmarensis TaxID=3351344 RepID=A0ABW7AWN5_9ACTN